MEHQQLPVTPFILQSMNFSAGILQFVVNRGFANYALHELPPVWVFLKCLVAKLNRFKSIAILGLRIVDHTKAGNDGNPIHWRIELNRFEQGFVVPVNNRFDGNTISNSRKGSPMQQPITGFHQDENSDWVAELACGHFQHVLHNPPWTVRPWTTSPEGRESMIGYELECKKCDEGAAADHISE